MQLNPNTIKTLRQKHNWTQQLLADACDVSLRTIQRVEKEGAASKETTMSLCSVFEVRQGELIKLDTTLNMDTTNTKKVKRLYQIIVLSSLVSFVLGMSSVLLFVK